MKSTFIKFDKFSFRPVIIKMPRFFLMSSPSFVCIIQSVVWALALDECPKFFISELISYFHFDTNFVEKAKQNIFYILKQVKASNFLILFIKSLNTFTYTFQFSINEIEILRILKQSLFHFVRKSQIICHLCLMCYVLSLSFSD